MSHLLRMALKSPPPGGTDASAFPFSLPVVQQLPALDLSAPVTLFVGENGTGKSTVLEGLAAAAELPSLGGSDLEFDLTLAPQRRLGAALRLSWARRSRKGFFLRAEDFFGYLRNQARIDARIKREKLEESGAPPVLPTDDARHVDEREAARFIARYDSRSHGESFLDVFGTRIHPGGLYLLDEPESPLSPMKQLALLSILMKAASRDAQFVIATHSPILLSCPGARIFSFDHTPVIEVRADDLEHITLTRQFLNDPQRYLRQLR
jgi:predicted ATPase